MRHAKFFLLSFVSLAALNFSFSRSLVSIALSILNWNIKLWNETWNSIFKVEEVFVISQHFALNFYKHFFLLILPVYDRRIRFLCVAWKFLRHRSLKKCFFASAFVQLKLFSPPEDGEGRKRKSVKCEFIIPSIKSNLFWWISFDGDISS